MAMTLRTDEELARALGRSRPLSGCSAKKSCVARPVLKRYERASHRRLVKESADRIIAQ